jgi:ureidoglycolate dehydrogenase (NAD+)
MIAIDICRFAALEVFKKRIDEVIRKVKQGRKAAGFNEILIPGEPEFLEEEKRLAGGIFIEDGTIGQISEIASRLHVKMPEPFISAPKPR